MILDLFDSLMQRIKANDKVHVTFCVSGIIGCLVVYGVLQVRDILDFGPTRMHGFDFYRTFNEICATAASCGVKWPDCLGWIGRS